MRQIKASEVKPGMKVQFDLSGWDVKGTVATVDVRPHAVWIYTEERCEMSLDLDTPVTVLAEPHPEEPTEFGAKVRVRKGRFVRLVEGDAGFLVWFEEGTESWWTWDELCEMGPVTVVPDQGWEVPADAPEVPERIEEWPENDEHLRAYRWRDRDGDLWYSISDSRTPWVVGFADRTGAFHPYPKRGPFTRVTDA